MRIDFSASTAEEAAKMGVKIGCPVTPDSEVACLGKDGFDLVIGPAFNILSKDPPKKVKVYAVATTQEEIGLRGAQVSAYNIQL
jgi:putative aminopeptidase FrvX